MSQQSHLEVSQVSPFEAGAATSSVRDCFLRSVLNNKLSNPTVVQMKKLGPRLGYPTTHHPPVSGGRSWFREDNHLF